MNHAVPPATPAAHALRDAHRRRQERPGEAHPSRPSAQRSEARVAHHRGAVIALLATLVAAAAAGCDRAPGPGAGDEPAEPLVAFDTGSVRIETEADTFQLRVELAESTAQRTHGMMEHDRLAPDEGMLFLFSAPQDPSTGFYMFRTRYPLDIAFLDENGRIVAIRTMQPCDSPNPDVCPGYAAGTPYSSALEVNAGYFAQHGVDVGDRVVRTGQAADAGESSSEAEPPGGDDDDRVGEGGG